MMGGCPKRYNANAHAKFYFSRIRASHDYFRGMILMNPFHAAKLVLKAPISS